jgi:glycosyltransferase involved in cell wall biosynthesis/2-polyprenyl-3-methyl-5-hydroxy-6-metoxy-1,4-benzoquinol methylase
MADYEYDFDPNAVNNTAASVYRLVRPGGPRVLDLGSGSGIVAAHLTAHDGKQVTCVDNSAPAVAAARERGIARVITADLADPLWSDAVAGESFDVIVMADVLEHLVDPGALVAAIDERELLTDDGYLVISIPNAGHEAVLAELIKGRFTYQDTGLLDSTHLRFFTLASLRELLERTGFFITGIERTRRTAEQTTLAGNDVTLPAELRDLVLAASAEAQTYQFVVKAERADAARELAELREQLAGAAAEMAERERRSARDADAGLMAARAAAEKNTLRLETELAEARRDRAVLEQRVAELSRALAREQRLTATERKRYEQALTTATRQVSADELDRARREVRRLEKKLADVYRSRTWKVGRSVWSAFHAPARLVRRVKPASPSPVAPETMPEVAVEVPGYTLIENRVVRDKYEAALSRSGFTTGLRHVAFAVYTNDLDAGRGDLYTAVGLGRHLEEVGFEVIYLPQERWYEIPEDTHIYVAMLETVDVTRLPAGLTTVAWVRNQTEAWVDRPWLPLYDLVLTSSQLSLEALARVYPGPTGLLSIGVDTELFSPPPGSDERRGVVSTVNQWGREREVLAWLKEKTPDFPLALYGHQRGLAPPLAPYAHGPVSFFALPSLYRQARIVLDDFNHTTAGYGNVNSRLFEAAACGAQVLTNRTLGLEDLGLDDVGVFSSARELFDLIEHGLETEPGDGTARVVAERHSYRQRALEFTRQLDRSGEREPGDGAVVVSHYPDYRDNPFTEMMWSVLRSRRGITLPVDERLNFTATIRASRHRPTVFHLNWTAPILGGARDDHERLERHRRFVEAIDEMHANGIPSIWTVHNVLPHECADRELEARLRQEIADRVDVVHVMCTETVAACVEWFEIPESKVRVIPHPSYIDVYPNLVDRATARDALGLREDDFVYLHFGQIRPYKGVDRLLDAFDAVSQLDRDARLLLVGKPGRFEGVRRIVDRARANPRVVGNFNPVPDGDIQLYMNAADIVVLPHQTALNSGALLLAYSFARPVVASATGCIAVQVDDTTGVAFDWSHGPLALQNAMLAARELGPEHAAAGYARAQDVHYLKISKKFAEVVDDLLAGRSGRV